AVDRDRKRIGRIEENLKRLSFNAEIRALALEELNEAAEFDRILLDAPCSATGIIRRHPDIKLLRLKSDIAKLAVIQRALLQKAFDLLKPGGELVYATCSVLPTENELLVSAFLESNARASSLPIRLSATSDAIISTRNGVQLLPTQAGHDGFYYARIGKAS
ncbi:MAG: 16S rRNA (cytosine(967)-C(5))-methyltransferase, partial [Pseudomonadales bacterium]